MSGNECEATRQSQVSTQCSNIEKQIEILHTTISKLEERLSRVTREEPLCTKEADERIALVPLASQLEGCGARIAGAARRIEILLDILEL